MMWRGGSSARSAGLAAGWQRAKELIYTGDTIDAQKALQYGLVAQVFPQARLMEEVGAIAKKIADAEGFKLGEPKSLTAVDSDALAKESKAAEVEG